MTMGMTIRAAGLTLVLGLAACLSTSVLAEPFGTNGAADWPRVEGAIEPLVDLRAEEDFVERAHQDLPSRLERLMERAVEVLATGSVTDQRRRLTEIRKEQARNRAEIDRMRFQMAAAPPASEGLVLEVLEGVASFVRPTKETWARRIEEREGDIAMLQAEAQGVRREFAAGLAEIGVNLSEAQVEGLLAMATGDDIVEMMAVFEAMEAVNSELRRATLETGESLEVAKRYYGIHLVLLEVAELMHARFVEQVDDIYLRRLQEISEDAQELRSEAQALLANERDPQMRAVLESNIAAQDLTLRASRLYRQQLQAQRASVADSLSEVGRRVTVARNTWKTVRLSSELVSLLRGSNDAFETLMRIDVPDLRPFESIELQRELERLTEELEEPTS